MVQCLKTQLKEAVDALLPQVGFVKFHPPYSEDYGQTQRTFFIGSSSANTVARTTGTFANGRNTINVTPNTKISTYFSNEAGGSILSFENYCDIIDLSITEAMSAGIKGDSNLDSLMRASNIKRILFRGDPNQKVSKSFLKKASTLIAFFYNCGENDTEQGEIVSAVIKNNQNLRYVEINTAATTPLIEEVQNLDLIQDYRGWIGNLQYIGVGARRKDINIAKDFGNLQNLINRFIAAGRTSGAIYMNGLLYADNVFVGSVTGRAFCAAEGVTANPLYITWDSNGTIHATSTRPSNYEDPNISINSQQIENIIY